MDIPEVDFMVTLLPEPHCSAAAGEATRLLTLILKSTRAAVPVTGAIDYPRLFRATQQLVS